MFGSPLRRLENELATLDAQIARHAMALVRGGASPEELLDHLKPLTLRSVELKNRIRERTPWRRLRARRDELLRALPAMPDGIERSRAELELTQLDHHLLTQVRRRPMSMVSLALFAAVVCAMVLLPRLLVDWFAA
jgi:hypothetical protein